MRHTLGASYVRSFRSILNDVSGTCDSIPDLVCSRIVLAGSRGFAFFEQRADIRRDLFGAWQNVKGEDLVA